MLWGSSSDCITNKQCLLSICGQSNAVFNAASVTSLKGGSGEQAWRLAVCVNKRSQLTFRKSSFTMNQDVQPLTIHSNSTSVLVDQCTIQGNNITGWPYSSAVHVRAATRLTVLSSTVAANTATGTGVGAITAFDTAEINIHGTSFYRNAAANGAAIHAKEQAMVTIQGSRFEGNNATARGGAIYATDQAQVKVLPVTLRNSPGAGECLCMHMRHLQPS